MSQVQPVMNTTSKKTLSVDDFERMTYEEQQELIIQAHNSIMRGFLGSNYTPYSRQ